MMAAKRVRAEEPEWVVWLLVILLLAAGWILRGAIVGSTDAFNGGGVALKYPAGWTSLARETPHQILYVGDSASSAQFPPSLQVRQIPAADLGRNLTSLGDLALRWSTQQAEALTAYQVLGIQPQTVRGQQVIAIDYAYVALPIMGAGNIPVVERAQDVLVRNSQANQVTILTFAADAAEYEAQAKVWGKILGSLELR